MDCLLPLTSTPPLLVSLVKRKMKEFNYELDYSALDFTQSENRHLYRIARGEQGVLLVRPYTDEICQHWRFKTVKEGYTSSCKIYSMFLQYLDDDDFIGADMARKFLEMGFTRARRYANHADGKKYNKDGTVRPQEKDWATSEKARSAKLFKTMRDLAANNHRYKVMRKAWREAE